MNLKECYAAMGGDYEGAMNRLRSEKLAMKFVLKFLDDPSFGALRQAMAEGNREDAFRAAHTLKGLCLNLGFTRLGNSSSALTEALRSAVTPQAGPLLVQVEADYAETAAAIRALA